MPRTRQEPWASFAAWLRDERQVTRQTASNYVSLVRRILAGITIIESDAIASFVDGHPSHHRSPMRAAWRRFVEWSAQKADPVAVPTFPVIETETLPDDVQAAIRVLRQDGITAQVMRRLTWDVETDQSLVALMPTAIWLRPPEGVKHDYLPVSKAAAKALRTWAYGDDEPTPSDPVVPRSPNDHRPMPLATIRRVLRGSTRTVQQAG